MEISIVKEFSDGFQESLPGLCLVGRLNTKSKLYNSFKTIFDLQVIPLEDETLKKHLGEAIKKNLARISKSPFKAVFFVQKKDVSLQLVTNYCALEAITVKNCYPLLLIRKLLDQLSGANIFSKIYLTAVYNQVYIAEKDLPKTAPRTRYGAYKSVVMNFGMTNAPLTFVTLKNSVL